jgi:cob(I)alamin adenosyltransferase
LARTVARRAEREVLRLSEEQAVNPEVVIYLNRLSDYLFVAARWANHQNKVEDVLWDQTK